MLEGIYDEDKTSPLTLIVSKSLPELTDISNICFVMFK